MTTATETPPLEGAAPQTLEPTTPLSPSDADAFNSVTDVDELELRSALDEAKAETGNDDGGISPPGAPAPLAPVAKDPPASPARQPIMIPKERLDETLQANRDLRERNIYLEGLAQGAAKVAGNPPADAPPVQRQPTAADQLAAVDLAIDAIAKRYDDGEMTMAEFEKERRGLQRRQDDLRENVILQKVDQRIPRNETAMSDKIVLQQETTRLEAAHPYATAMTVAQLELLVKIAREEAAAAGKPIGTDTEATLRLRGMVAELSDLYGPRWGLKAPAAKAVTTTPTSQAARDRAAKLGLAATHPPDTGALGHAAGGTREELTDSAIGAMSDDMVEALPASVRQRLLT